MALFLGLTSAARTTGGGIPRLVQTKPARPALASAAVLIAVLGAVLVALLFAAPPAGAQGQTQVTVSFSRATSFAAEGDTTDTTTVGLTLSVDPGREVVIPITVSHRGGASSADYSGVPSSVTFGVEDDPFYCDDGESTCYETYQSFTFTASTDTVDDDGEGVELEIGSMLPAGVSLGKQPTTTVWIIDDGGRLYVGLPQVGVGVSAHISDDRVTISNAVWQWQRSATEHGAYSDIPATEGGTSTPYTPSAGDLGMWLRAKATFDDDNGTGKTSQSPVQQVLSQPVLSNAGYIHWNLIGYGVSGVGPLYAQRFTTGSDTRGYVLTGVRLALSLDSRKSASGTWAIYADDAGKPAALPLSPGRPILNADINEDIDTFKEFTHPDGVLLQPDTGYWVVISQTSPVDKGIIFVDMLSDFGNALPLVAGFDPNSEVEEEKNFCKPPLASEREELCRPAVDTGSQEGWSLNIPVLTYYVEVPGDAFDTNPDPDLAPWFLVARKLELPSKDRFVLRMSLLVAPAVTVQFTQDSYTVAEGESQTVTVQLSADAERRLVIPISTTDEDGATSADYSVPSSVTFAAGQTSQTFVLTATQDTVDDDDETVKLGFGTMPDAWVTVGTRTETTVSITDDDDPEVTVQFGQGSYTVAEGGTQSVTVTLSEDPERTVIIPVTSTGQDGATSADYSVPTSVTFDSGETSKSFTFTASEDTVDDDDESVLLEFGTMPDARVSAGATDQATVNITDDDDPEVTVQFGQASQGVGEGETVNVTFSLSADPERTVVIPVTSTGQGGATAADYSVPTSVTFNDGEVEKTIAFMAATDDADDDDESVKLGFGTTLPARVSAGARTETTLNIGDDDDPTVTVVFSQSAYTVAEGGTQSVTVTLSADPERTVIIPVTRTLEGTASAADYSGVPASVTFNSGDTSKSFTFSATQDDIDDDSEGVKLGFGTMPDPRISAGTTKEVTLSITDDDTAAIVISLTLLSVDEENESEYTVRLDTEPTVDVTVTISGQAGTDLSLESVKLSNDALTFTPANWDIPQTVTVEAAHDDDGVNDDATLTLTASGAEYANVERALPVTVLDNDPPGISIDPMEMVVDESDSADYNVSLDTEPTVAVTVTITGHSGTDLSLSGPSLSNDALTFTAANWATPQTVTVAAAHDEDTEDDTATLIHTSAGGEYAGLTKSLPVTVDDNTGDLRLVDGTLTTEDGELCEGRLEIYYDGDWGTICDDYWTEPEADVACRALGFFGGAVEDYGRFRTAVKAGFSTGTSDQTIVLDDLHCTGRESGLLECGSGNRPGERNNCSHMEDVGLRCIKNSEGPHVINMEISAAPGGNGKYDVGETVTVTLEWNEPVDVVVTPPVSPSTVSHPPHLYLAYGSGSAPTTKAIYTSGSGTARTVFTATVEDRGNAPYSTIDVYPESLTTEILNDTPGQDPVGSSITSVSDNKPAILGHGFYQGPETGQQVEAVTITGVPSFNHPGDDGVFGHGETVEVTFTFSQPVQVDTTGGTPSGPVLLSGTDARQALYVSGSGTGRLVFGYTLVETDGEHGSILVDPDSLTLNGGTIQDVANNQDAYIGHQGGGAFFLPPPDLTAPQLQSAAVDGATVTLTYDETLDVSATPPSSAFTVNVNGESRSLISVGVGTSSVLLFLSTAVESGDTVTVDYTAPTGASANKLQDTSGNTAESFSAQAVTNNTASSNVPRSEPVQAPGSPTNLEVTRHESGKLTASWDAPNSGPSPTGYSLQWKESANDWANQDDIAEAEVTGTSHIITGLTDGTVYAIRVISTTDNAESTPSGEVLVTPRETVPPAPSAAAVDGATLAITFDEPLDAGRAPDNSAFSVTVAGSNRGVDAVSVSGSVVTLSLVAAVTAGDTVTVDYTTPAGESANKLQDLVGNAASSFSGQQVTNSTQSADPLTASAHDVPESHDGSSTFTFELRFSESPRKGFSYKIMRDHAFTVAGGDVTKARRLEQGKNLRWEIHVRPGGDGTVTIVLPITADCTTEGAICTQDRRPLSNTLEIAIPGPGG